MVLPEEHQQLQGDWRRESHEAREIRGKSKVVLETSREERFPRNYQQRQVAGHWVNKMWRVRIIKYDSTMGRNKVLTHVTTQRDLKHMRLRKRNKSRKTYIYT